MDWGRIFFHNKQYDICPNSTTTAETISHSANSSGSNGTYKILPITNSKTYTQSVYIKKIFGSSTSYHIGNDISGFQGYISINPQSMTITTNRSAVITSSIHNVGNGWYRVSVTWTSTSTSAALILYNADTTPLQMAVWGYQLEEGAFPTSYIPTTTAALTRAADTLTIPTASWITQGRGVLFSRAISPPLSSSKFPGAVAIDDGTINNALQHFIWDGQDDKTGNVIFLSGNTIYDQRGATMLSGGIFTQATAYAPHNAPDNMNASVNGTLLVPNMTTTVPTFNTMRVGARRGGGDPLNACIQQIRYYPLRISDAQLQILTQ